MKKGLNPEEYRAYQRENYAKHAEKRRAARKARYWADPEKARADSLAYQERKRGGPPQKRVKASKVKAIAARPALVKVEEPKLESQAKLVPLPTEIRDAYKASSRGSIIQRKYKSIKALHLAYNRGELHLKP